MESEVLRGKIAIVTGARRGIGSATALIMARAGADVVVCDSITEDGLLEKLSQQIEAAGRRSLPMKTDIARKLDVQRLAVQTREAFGHIDILVNCAGVWIHGQTLLECPEENWDKVMNINLKGTYLCCQAVGSIMASQRSGCIINLSSQVGLTAGSRTGAYSISKAGIIMLTKQLALELAEYNIRVNSIAPGVVKTEFNSQFWKDPEAEKRTAGMIPLQRLAETEDIARAALFLASDYAGYITGEVLAVNGGWRP